MVAATAKHLFSLTLAVLALLSATMAPISAQNSTTASSNSTTNSSPSTTTSKLSVSAVYGKKDCQGIPSAIVYSNVARADKDTTCKSMTGESTGDSYKLTFDIADPFADSMERFGCDQSFVLVGRGKSCKVGVELSANNLTNATFWLGFPADGKCHPFLTGFSGKNTSVKAKIRRKRLQLTKYKDSKCNDEDSRINIDSKSKKVDDKFCEDGDLYQVYEANARRSSLFRNKPTSDCKSKVTGDNKSSAVGIQNMNSLLVSTWVFGVLAWWMV